MKKLILLALIATMMIGCERRNKQTKQYHLDNYIGESSPHNPYLVIIDSCEYIRGYEQMAHKGNCRFCTERRKQELRELAKELKVE